MATCTISNVAWNSGTHEYSCSIAWSTSSSFNVTCTLAVEVRGIFHRPNNVNVNATPEEFYNHMQAGASGNWNVNEVIYPDGALSSQKPADAVSLEYWFRALGIVRAGLPAAQVAQDEQVTSHYTHTY